MLLVLQPVTVILMVHIVVQQVNQFTKQGQAVRQWHVIPAEQQHILLVLLIILHIVRLVHLLNAVKLPNRYKVVSAEVVQH